MTEWGKQGEAKRTTDRLAPKSCRTPEVEGETLKITLKKPADLRVVVNDNPALALFTYPTYKKPSGKDVHSLADEKGVDATGKTDQTAVLPERRTP